MTSPAPIPTAIPVNLTRAEIGTLLGALVAAGASGSDVTALRDKLRDKLRDAAESASIVLTLPSATFREAVISVLITGPTGQWPQLERDYCTLIEKLHAAIVAVNENPQPK